jgi:hypothetical protein
MGLAGDLTEAVLRKLYLEDGLSETEIAKSYGIYQVKVGRLRRQFGIPTLAKSDRLDIPDELTPRQVSVLIGSMLGDGGLRVTSRFTARYTEHHCLKQKPYLDWKAEEWGPFLSSVAPADKGPHPGFRLVTHSFRALHPFWMMFYPTGKGDKTFVHLPVNLVDPLSLAVWFMDDGSRTDSYVRFSVGPNEEDHKVRRKVLRKFGIDSHLYGNPGDQALHIQGRTDFSRFLDLVQPHIHPSMTYKLELKVPRKLGPAPRHILTSERVNSLLERGFSAQGIADVLRTSRQSVLRALDRMQIAHPRVGRPAKGSRKELTVEAATLGIQRMDSCSVSYAEDVLAVLLQTEIPLPTPSEDKLARDATLLREAKTHIEGETLVAMSRGGISICNQLFPYRWDARYRSQPSVREAWYEPKLLRRAIQFQISVGDPLVPPRVFRALQAVVHGPTNFRPCFAKAIVEAYSPPEGVVLDPCAGYGGRAAGTLVTGRTYVGVDPHPQAKLAFLGLQKVFGGHLEFHHSPFEDADLGDLSSDLVFTSPPYFNVERYSEDSSQSWVRYFSWQSWVDGFLRPLVIKSEAHLKSGGYFCVNTKNVRAGRQQFPIADELVKLAGKAGLQMERTLQLPLGRIGKEALTEPIFVFLKPMTPV